jgi:hypothetical protein
MNKLILVSALIFMSSSAYCDDFSNAVEQHAKTSARDLISGFVDSRSKGVTWKQILSDKLPKQLDDRCGYRELINLPENGFDEMRTEVASTVGSRLVASFQDILSRPGSKVDLVSVKNLKLTTGDHSLVTLRVIPAQATDKNLSLLYQLNSEGTMSLCDIIPGDAVADGILSRLGKELNL